MKVLHVYPKSDELIQRHVAMLCEGMSHSADISCADSSSDVRKKLRELEPDILHCHGCWHYHVARAAQMAIKQDTRVVHTLHGQLEPWIMDHQSMQEKISKSLLWQRKVVERAYAVITMGRLEKQNFTKLGWNSRIEVIRNAVTTNTITPQQMCTETFNVYQKVMDSNTLELMNDHTVRLLYAIIKAGIMGDRRWVRDGSYNASDMTAEDWRHLFIYANHENIRNYVDYGITVLQLQAPSIDAINICSYFPEDYVQPRPLRDIIGNYDGDENKYVFRMIRQLNRQPLLSHMIELHRELHRDNITDEKLEEMLKDHRLLAFARGLMQILSEQTQLDEGFMPVAPTDNRMAKRLRKQITNHLKI